MMNEALTALRDPALCRVQPYFSDRIQLAEVIDRVLSFIGPAHLTVSTFSTSEEFLRRIYRIQQSGRILSVRLFCDFRATSKTLSLYDFIRSMCTSVHLTSNHSKVVLLSNDTAHVAVVTSQNQTRGDRFEAGIITSDDYTFNRLSEGFGLMEQKSVSTDEILKR